MRLSKSLKQLITNTARDAYAKGVADGERKILTGLKAVAQLNGSAERLLKGGWDENKHPRADDGRFGDKPGGREAGSQSGPPSDLSARSPARERHAKTIAGWAEDIKNVMAVRDPAARKAIADRLQSVADLMPDYALHQFVTGLAGPPQFRPSVNALTESLNAALAREGRPPLKSGQRVGGMYQPGGDKGWLTIDGADEGLAGDTAGQIMAHEIGHVLDGPRSAISGSPEWAEAFRDEIDHDHEPLSKYARTDPSEGFAEFFRLATFSRKQARREFPKCWAVLESYMLV